MAARPAPAPAARACEHQPVYRAARELGEWRRVARRCAMFGARRGKSKPAVADRQTVLGRCFTLCALLPWFASVERHSTCAVALLFCIVLRRTRHVDDEFLTPISGRSLLRNSAILVQTEGRVSKMSLTFLVLHHRVSTSSRVSRHTRDSRCAAAGYCGTLGISWATTHRSDEAGLLAPALVTLGLRRGSADSRAVMV